MLHSTPLITTIATALGMALVLGFLAVRLKLPALVGYLLAGILLGPFTPGFVADAAIAGELAEIGVMLLMFGVGLHFSLDDLLEVRKIAVPGAALQIAVATALGAGAAAAWGWGLGAALVFGLALSVASTVVLLRALEASGALESMNGRIAVGWLIVEDLAMVLVLVLLPPLAGALGGTTPGSDGGNLWQTLGITLVKVSAFIALMLVVGRRAFPALLWQVTRTGSRELFTLCVVAAAVSIAYAATALFGVSFALGAFFAGMVKLRHPSRCPPDTLAVRPDCGRGSSAACPAPECSASPCPRRTPTPNRAIIASVISIYGLEINSPTTSTVTVRSSSGKAISKAVRNWLDTSPRTLMRSSTLGVAGKISSGGKPSLAR